MLDEKSVKLSAYVPEVIDKAFRQEAKAKYRNLSDHLTAVLAERYGYAPEGSANGHEHKPEAK